MAKGSKVEGTGQKVYYWDVTVSAVQESPNLDGDSYIIKKTGFDIG
jgi:hypothetical protein